VQEEVKRKDEKNKMKQKDINNCQNWKVEAGD